MFLVCLVWIGFGLSISFAGRVLKDASPVSYQVKDFFKKFNLCMYTCLSSCVSCVDLVSKEARRGGQIILELELQGVVSCSMWVP